MKRKSFILLILCILTFGCLNEQTSGEKKDSSTSEKKEEAKKLPFKIIESTYKVESGLGNSYLKYAVVLENPNESFYGVFPTFTITARDSSGNVVGTEDQTLREFPPGTKIAWGGQISLTKIPEAVDFAVAKVEWKETVTKPKDYLPFEVEKINFTPSVSKTYTVSGDVKNPYDKEVSQIAVTSLLRDEKGKLIGGNTTFVESLPASGSRPFSDQFVSVEGKPNKAEVFVIPWGQASWNRIVTEK